MSKREKWLGQQPSFTRLSVIMPEVVAPAFKKRGVLEAKLLSEWSTLVGREMAQKVTPVKCSFPRRDSSSHGVLYVKVDNAYSLEIQHNIPLILEKIAIYLGYNAIEQIKITHK